MPVFQNEAIQSNDQLELFSKFGGYLDLNNDDLQYEMISWELANQENLGNHEIVFKYIPWCFSASFLQMINAWQWFFSGVLLSQQCYLPAQSLQCWYYATFFSSVSFLASQLRGIFTINIEYDFENDTSANTKRNRKAIWIESPEKGEWQIALNQPVQKGGQHETIANWFYDVFNKWDNKRKYPDVDAFVKDRKFHTNFRNLFTYSLGDIAEELFSPDDIHIVDNQIIKNLWERDVSEVEIHPETFWALEHLRVATDIHMNLVSATKVKNAIKFAQRRLINGFVEQHTKTGFIDVIKLTHRELLKK